MIYLDNAATTFPKPREVYEAMDEANRNYAVNAGRGGYRLARKASALIEDTRIRIRRLVGADMSSDVTFSPSVTIALNQIIKGVNWKENSFIYVSPYEHNAVARTLNYLSKEKKITVKELPITEKLEIDIGRVKYEFSKYPPAAVFCTHISNVTGYILPTEEIFSAAKAYKALTVLDTAQSLGLIETDSRMAKADLIAFAGHKSLYGPIGIGGFINIAGIPMNPVIIGGTGSDSLNLEMPDSGEGKFEAASSNIVAMAGLNAALHVLDAGRNYRHESELTRYLIDELREIKGVRVFAPYDTEKHIAVVSFVVEGMKSEDVGMILDEDFDIAVRTGYHCAPYIHKYLKDEKYLGTVRVGVGQFTVKEDVDDLAEAVKDITEGV